MRYSGFGKREDHPELSRTPVPPGRTTMPAGRVTVVIGVCLLTWTVLYAPTLKRASEAQPLGIRRTVSLDVLGPIAAIGDVTGLGRLVDAIQRAAGHGPNSLLQAEPLPTASESPGVVAPPLRTTAIRDFTAGNKLRVVVVGDSLAQGLGFYMERVLSPNLVRVSSQGRISTGLARPDYFNWPAEMQRIENVFHPDLVIVMLGENDHQSLLTPQGQLDTATNTSAWPNAYAHRVREFIHIAVDNGSHVVWAGLPAISDTSRWDYIRQVDGIYARVAIRTPNAAYLDTFAMFTTPSGRYTPFMRINGKVVPVREADGIHFTAAGYQLLARAAVGIAEQRFSLATKAVA
jgi:uncharacterized protein